MLVLERKNGQSVSVFVEGREVRIRLIASESGRSKIGIEAPEETLILREEVLNATPESFEQHLLA